MATSRFHTSQHTSEQLVESAGDIVFRLSTQEVCVLHLLPRDEYILAKGKRNVGESRWEVALREVREETGYCCSLLPVTMGSRAPPAVETEPYGDVLRTYSNITEPFSLQIRHLQTEGDVKLIWWFIAAADEDKVPNEDRPGEEKFQRGVLRIRGSCEEADIPNGPRHGTAGNRHGQSDLFVIQSIVWLQGNNASAYQCLKKTGADKLKL